MGGVRERKLAGMGTADELTANDIRALRALLERVSAGVEDAQARGAQLCTAAPGDPVSGAGPYRVLWAALVACAQALTALDAAWPWKESGEER